MDPQQVKIEPWWSIKTTLGICGIKPSKGILACDRKSGYNKPIHNRSGNNMFLSLSSVVTCKYFFFKELVITDLSAESCNYCVLISFYKVPLFGLYYQYNTIMSCLHRSTIDYFKYDNIIIIMMVFSIMKHNMIIFLSLF